jgi:hypothetical protein
MTDPTYTVEPDGNGVLTLWRGELEVDEHPTPLADLDGDYQDVFWAAAAVLAPDDEVRELVAKAIDDPGLWLDDYTGIPREGQADAVLAALKSHATGGGDDE